MSAARFTVLAGIARGLIGAGGGFACSLSFMMGLAAFLAMTGVMTRGDAVVTSAMLSFLVWMSAVLVAFGAASLARACYWVLGSTLLFLALAWLCI